MTDRQSNRPELPEEGRTRLPSAEAWQRLRSHLPQRNHERLDRVRYTAEKVGSDRLGVDFELLLLLHESNISIAEIFRDVSGKESKKIVAALEDFSRKNKAAIRGASVPTWRFWFSVLGVTVTIFALLMFAMMSFMAQQNRSSEARIKAEIKAEITSAYLGILEKTEEQGIITRGYLANRTSQVIRLKRGDGTDNTYQVFLPHPHAANGGYWQKATVTFE